MTTERKKELARQLVAIIFELTSAGEVPTDVMPVSAPQIIPQSVVYIPTPQKQNALSEF